MQLIKRTTLLYQAGSSDKIYEVDLCQTGENRYLVNFRYGRRGTNLKEGSKTVQAVPLAEAQRVFDKLVDSQIQKGYRDVTNGPTSETTAPATVQGANTVPVTGNTRHQAIINRLANRDNRKWPLERAIWRAGELKIREATPLLIGLIGTGEPLRDYCIAWALGWCGDESAIGHVRRLSQDRSVAEFVRRIAWEALFKLSDERTRTAMRSEKIEQLPSELRDLAQNGSIEAFATALSTYLAGGYYIKFAVLDTIYQINNEYVRPALLDILCDAPLKPNYFQRIRHIYKMAEYRHDAEVFGILAYTFDKEPGTFDNQRTGWHYDSVKRTYRRSGQRRYSEELKSPQSRKAYSNQTREYLRRRVWDTLATLGQEGDKYVNMAVNVLLQYADDDAQPVQQSTFRRWNQQRRTYDQYTRNWDAYAGYLIFNHILYQNSQRYILIPGSKAWRCREGYNPGDPEPKVREEAFPELWEQNPSALVHLLLESDCRPVHHFAVKALRVCNQFCNQLNVDTLIKLLLKPYEVTAELSFLLARERYNPAQPNSELILAVANCVFPEARTQAYRWIEQQRDYFLDKSDFIALLVTSQQAETRAFARRLLTSILSDATARVLIGRIIAAVLALSPTQTDMASEIGETLLISFTPQLRNLGFGVILDLLRHPMPEIQELGARILLNHEIRATDLPPDLIESLLASPYESVRGIGVRIFGQLPDEKLMGDRILIVAMAINAITDIRNAIRPVIRRLATNHPDFGIQLASDFIDILTTPERHEGVHSNLVRVMREDIPGWMSHITKEKAIHLLRAKSSVVQELGGIVLSANRERFVRFNAAEIVKLANHEILSVREAAQEMFMHNLNSIRTNSQEMLSAVRLLESKWDDIRDFASRIFSNEFTTEDWTPEIMVSICDSVREDVRSFGRDLVTRNFQQHYGQEYLLKFSEHPSADMQILATNYLENYAVNNPDRLRELTPYFVSVLCRVNRGRIAKQRIFAFLEIEAQKSEAAAKIIADILTQQSVTIAIGDKAAAIQIMLKIYKTYPQIHLPIQVKPVAKISNADAHR